MLRINSTQLGTLSLRTQTASALLLDVPVYADVQLLAPDFQYGIETAAFDGSSDEAQTGALDQPAFFHRCPHATPLNEDLRTRRRLELTYRDVAVKSSAVPNAYVVKVYLTVVEADEELEKLPEPQRTQAYDRAICAYHRR